MKKNSRLVVLFLVFCLVFSYGRPSANASSEAIQVVQGGVTIYVNGQIQTYGHEATVEKGRTLAPVRGIFESLGASVNWNSKTQTVEAYKGNTKISLKIGSRNAKVNGKTVTLSVPAKLKNGRTLVPLRFISEAFGESVHWDSSLRAIYIGKFPTLGKQISAVPKGATIVKEGIGYIQYSYNKSLPGGGKITEVSVSANIYGSPGGIQVTIYASDHKGVSFWGTKYNSEERIKSYGAFMQPVLGSDDYDEINLVASQFLKSYGR